jgi:hypothetical protein
MRLGLVVAMGIGVLDSPLWAQDCPAVVQLPPAGTLSGALGSASCVLNDGSSYTAYRLDLPVRGKIGIGLSGMSSDLQFILRNADGARLDSGSSIRRALEAGTYNLLVNGKTSGETGPFTVTTTFVAELSMLCKNYPNIGHRQTIANTLGNYGCTAPDGTPYDGWALTTYGAGTLTITASSQDFSPTVTLRGSDGRALASSVNGILVSPVQADSQYTLVVASADKTGTYQLTTAFQNATDDTCHSTGTFTDSANDNAAITADSCYVTIPGSGDQLYYNYYNVQTQAAGVLSFTVTSGDFTPTLYLLDEAGNTLAFDSVGGGYDTSGIPHSYLRVSLPPGNYLLQTLSDASSGGNYQLQYSYSTDPQKSCRPTSVNPGDLMTGSLSPSSCRTSLGLTDLYNVTLPTAGTLDLDLASLEFPAKLAIRDPKDNLIVRGQEVDGVTAAHITADLPAGVYTVAAAAQSYAGAYRLSSKFSAHDVTACGFTQAIDLNGGYIQRLTTASCKGADGQPVDYYGFTLSADSLVLGVVTSSEVDGFLTLLDSAANVLRTDDNGYGGIDPLIIQYLPAGSYKLAVRDASPAPGGLYEVDLRTVEGHRPAFCTARNTLSLGSSVDGNITYTGCQYDGQVFADLYQFILAADTTVDLGLNSSDFDAYLVLLDAKGNVVDEDDDGGGNTNARVTVPLAAGTYYVVAKPVGDYLKHGAYTLSARAVDATATPR